MIQLNNFKKLLIGALTLSCAAVHFNAQVSEYSFAQSYGTFTPINGTPLITATNTTGVGSLYQITPIDVSLPVGFNFNYNGKIYNDIKVTSNGYITLGSIAPTASTTTPISNTLGYEGAISAFGKSLNSFFDLGGQTGDIRTDVVGTAPNREFVIQWTNFRPAYSTSATSAYGFNFQIRLKETSNIIEMVYDGGSFAIGSTNVSGTVQIGLRGETNADFNNRTNTSSVAFTNSTPGTANSSTQYTSTTATAASGMPPAGFTYTWTPPTCFTPKNMSVSNLSTNSATINWIAPIPASSSYDVYYSTSSTAPDATTIPTISNVTGTTLNINNLQSGTTYYAWVRSNCSSTTTSWAGGATFTTNCTAISNYYEGFENTATGNYLPDCWTRLAVPTSGSQTISTTTPAAGLKNLYMGTVTTATTNPVVAILPEFDNLNTGTHWLRFRSRLSTAATSTLKVGYITDITDPTSFVNIQDVIVSNNTWSYPADETKIEIPSNLIIPAGARLAFTTTNDGKYFYIDEIYWEQKPTCLPPDTAVVTSVTHETATVSWNAPSITPAGGYDIYYSTTNTPPAATDLPQIIGTTGTSATVTNLTPSSTYYFWVRANCNANDVSTWSPNTSAITKCDPPLLTNVSATNFCVGQPSTLSATTAASNTINWYDSETSPTPLATGASYTTSPLVANTDFWVSAKKSNTFNVGPVSPSTLLSPGTASASSYYLDITVYNNETRILSVDVFPNAAGTNSEIQIYNGASTTAANLLHSIPFTTTIASGGTIPQVVPLNVLLQPGNYRIKINTGSYYRNYTTTSGGAGATFPYTYGDFSITGGSNSSSQSYYFLYNFLVESTCESPRQQVTATLDTTCLGTSEVKGKENIKIYPNPFSEIVNINNSDLVKTAKIMDVNGRLIRTINNPSSALKLQDLQQGMYILALEMKDGTTQSSKIIKK